MEVGGDVSGRIDYRRVHPADEAGCGWPSSCARASRPAPDRLGSALCAALGADPPTGRALMLPMRAGRVRYAIAGAQQHRAPQLRSGRDQGRPRVSAPIPPDRAGRSGWPVGAALGRRQAALARAAHAQRQPQLRQGTGEGLRGGRPHQLSYDYANVFLGNASEGLRLEATYGLPGELIGTDADSRKVRQGKCIERGEPIHQRLSGGCRAGWTWTLRAGGKLDRRCGCTGTASRSGSIAVRCFKCIHRNSGRSRPAGGLRRPGSERGFWQLRDAHAGATC